MPAITDTSPLNYLILIDAIELLPRLYQQVIVPQAVFDEVKHPGAPAAVSRWANALPGWAEVRSSPKSDLDPGLAILGRGEREAIALAEVYRDAHVLLLLDEEAARQQATARFLATTGTLGVLKSAAGLGWIDLAQAIDRLRQTNFRVSAKLLRQLLDDDARRKGHPL